MNSIERWCQLAAVTFMLILGIEGLLFGHDVAAQARSIQPQTVLAGQNQGHPQSSQNPIVVALEER